jgi:hypothetical protein
MDHIIYSFYYTYSHTAYYGDCNDLSIYLSELPAIIINPTRSASYCDLHIEINSKDRLRTNIYDKREDFNFHLNV